MASQIILKIGSGPKSYAFKVNAGVKGDRGDAGLDATCAASSVPIEGGHQVTIEGSQGTTTFDVMNGSTGAPGAYTEYQYARSDDPNNAPETGWEENPPTTGGKYLWCRERRHTF